MSKVLYSTGLSRLVENIKNKFQKKPYDVNITIKGNNNDNFEVIIDNDISFYNELKANYSGSKLNTNINYHINVLGDDSLINANASNIIYNISGDYFTVTIDFNRMLADDRDQFIGHLRFDVFNTGEYDAYYDEQNITYNDNYILTGTGTITKDTLAEQIGFVKIYNKHVADFTQEDKTELFKYKERNEQVACFVDGIFYISDYSTDDTVTFSAIEEPQKITSMSITKNGQHGGGNVYLVGTDAKFNITTNGDGTKFLADDGSYVHTSILINFEAESGSLDAKQKEDIDEGYNRNLPIYILYSGIKMLVNSIQKLGDVWSLSCSHEGVVYSVTVDTAEMSYNVITNV